MKNKRDAESKAVAALKAARDEAVAAEWDMHNYILGAKDQVKAQYGKSSNELQSLGLKKKTEYKTPGRKKSVTPKSATQNSVARKAPNKEQKYA